MEMKKVGNTEFNKILVEGGIKKQMSRIYDLGLEYCLPKPIFYNWGSTVDIEKFDEWLKINYPKYKIIMNIVSFAIIVEMIDGKYISPQLLYIKTVIKKSGK